MKVFFTMMIAWIATTGFSQKLTGKDLHLLKGNWKGSLTYIDYTSAKPYTMPVNTNVSQMAQNGPFILALSYPNEPKANGNDTFSISKNGRLFNGSSIVTLKRLRDGGIIITTETNGLDGNDNKEAVLKHVYTIQKNIFINRKEVKFAGEKEWRLRNEYEFRR